ncbi:hypothetical protein KR018_000592 [Drosophila ironensis]|nr:hypothetical protein KR018_000592 [Drosophila ironensis]
MSLIDYNTYEDYVDSFITLKDVRYIRNWEAQRNLILNGCGFNTISGLLSRKQFEERREKQLLLLKPRSMFTDRLFCDHLSSRDRVLKEFALREEKLMNRQLSTVVYLQTISPKKGMVVSSFIDLEQSMRESRFKTSVHYANWRGIFEGTSKLMPGKNDLSYLFQGKVRYTNSDNFRVMNERAHSLLLIHLGDHKIICVNAGCDCVYTKNATRRMVISPVYGSVIFFDHIIRRIN